MNNRLFIHTNNTEKSEDIINMFESYLSEDKKSQVYMITSPLGEKYNYDFEDNAIVVLIPKHKIVFLNLTDNNTEFDYYCDDFVEDLNSISDKYNYKEYIGRPRDWKEKNTIRVNINEFNTIDDFFNLCRIEDKKQQRVSDFLISLLIGSINDISKIGADVPQSLLEKVKKNIILFDGDQTRFIYQDFSNKIVTIQGLSGTGKTELLLHKLKDLYSNDEDSKIFFTCHNIALANTLRERIPAFFNFMKVEKQIEWNKRLWVNRAWGSKGDINSGLYSYICNFYNIPFLRYSPVTNYTRIFSEALKHLEVIADDNFEYAFDYLLIDERQDFPDVFFKVCEKITKKKVFVAGDIFQDIFESLSGKVLDVDVVLNKCYRTDPRTLMFAHSVGLGLFESKKLNWFDDEEWKAFGYILERTNERELHLTREPLRRFEDVDLGEFTSVDIIRSTHVDTVIDIIKELIKKDENIGPNDISIILLDDDNSIYAYIDTLASKINSEFGWFINRGHENKIKIDNALYISNPNNVKGLEFPFVICITAAIKKTYKYRNILYTMLTRSFIKSYLLLNDKQDITVLEQGLKIINEQKYIKTIEPTETEKNEIKSKLIGFLKKPQISYSEFLNGIFEKLNIFEDEKKDKIKDALANASIEKFDEETTTQFINTIKDFY
ncbi:DEAD/DEAH box helicase [Chryseobacterium oryctis]|uniref:DNA 3'-5' helicase II n=1 Tax=Chryseobacterium oryctis TaxID=2952618 RepID=A0ABT3HNS5_9FLAO|nr:ATP-binding domain-containing protein [Chryseobacterium oryctis]MCW3161350.1 ATP-binding domain-containing protein [Chryseobacterium oryctis]